MLVGVLSGPRGGLARRAAIRRSWMLYDDVGIRLTPCFVLGSRGLAKRARKSLDGRDVVWLDVEETGILSISKCMAWWRAASRGAEAFTHIAKVDDDSFINVPNFLHALGQAAALAPTMPLVFGPMAHAGYRPETFRMCGWSWQANTAAWRKLRCAERGFSKPFAFPLGAMQVLSSPLAKTIGTSSAVQEFAVAANASHDLRARDSNEDVALGYWIARLAAERSLNVSYRMINDRAPNLGCFRNGGLYKQPQPDQILLHRIKGAGGFGYVWRMLHDGVAHDPLTCARDATVELPKNSFMFAPAFAGRIRNGSIALTFNQKTNKVVLTFNRQKLSDVLNK